MSMFDLPTKARLPKIIGLIDHHLYVYLNNYKTLDIYSLNVYIPNSWKLQWHFEFEEIAYLSACVKASELTIYFLFAGCYTDQSDSYSLDILQLNVDQQEYERFKSSDAEIFFELDALYKIKFETNTLCCGHSDLYCYDRGTVCGQIPFTHFVLDHEKKTYSGSYEPIDADDPTVKPTIFGTLINPDEKKFVKLESHNFLRVFNLTLKKWVEYEQTREGSDIYLNDIITRHVGIGVTYNQEHTRFAIVSSQIKFVAGDNTCLLVYKYAGRVVFYRVLFDDENQQFKLTRVGKIGHKILQGYMYCNNDALIVLANPSYFVPLRVLTLKETSFKTVLELCDDAKDDTAIRKLCGITHERSLI